MLPPGQEGKQISGCCFFGQNDKWKGKYIRILVCVKQVPEPGTVNMNPETGSIVREGKAVINPFDLYAMEAAARLKDQDETVQISALCMGPAEAASVLKDCMALGADKAWLVSGEEFAGADIRAAARILQAAIEKLEREEGSFDAIFCGSKTTDGGTAMLPPYLGTLLDRSVATYALECRQVPEAQALEILKENDAGNEVYQVSLPCVISFTKSNEQTRYPLAERIIEASQSRIPVLTKEDLFGEEPAPQAQLTVAGYEYRSLKKSSLIIQEEDQEEGARKLVNMLYNAHVL